MKTCWLLCIILLFCIFCVFNKLNVKQISNQKLNVLILAGVHGNESGPSTYFSTVNLPEYFTVIPRANELAILLNVRGIPDLNRNWPNGSLNRKILPFILNADLIVDLHEGWGNGCTPPSLGQSLYTTDDRLIGLLENIRDELNGENENCMKWRVLQDQAEIPATLDYYCKKIKKPYILVEIMGQNSGISQKSKNKQLDVIVKNLRNFFEQR